MLQTEPPTALYSHIDAPVNDSGIERGGYYIHPGTVSEGCVTIPSRDRAKYDELRSLLEKTKKITFFAQQRFLVNGFQGGSGFLYVY